MAKIKSKIKGMSKGKIKAAAHHATSLKAKHPPHMSTVGKGTSGKSVGPHHVGVPLLGRDDFKSKNPKLPPMGTDMPKRKRRGKYG